METGLSDFHKMVVAVLKTKLERLKPKIIHYRDYKAFLNDSFREYLMSKLSLKNIIANYNDLENFLQVCLDALDNPEPQKKNTQEKTM